MKKQKQRKKEGGITLIALVVTIVILLILAGVTLGTVLSDGGLIDKTKEAIGEHEKAQEKEQEELGEAAGMMKNLIDGLGSTGETTPVTPPTPTGGTGSSEVAGNLKKYQGKYVDIGLDVDGDEDTTNDWEIFCVNEDRIFLISADYVPVAKLTEWNIIGTGASEDNGFTKCDENYCVHWAGGPTSFRTLPSEPDNFLNLVMHTQYNLNSNNGNSNSQAVSYLLDTTAWNGIKEAATKSNSIDFVIGGPTLEMWCEAWNKTVAGDENGFVEITPAPQRNGYGYYVSSSKTSNQSYLYISGETRGLSDAQLTALSTTYKTFFPHTEGSGYNGCFGYWVASPSADDLDYLMCVFWDGCMWRNFINADSGVRPIVSLAPGIQIMETEEGSGIYNLN